MTTPKPVSVPLHQLRAKMSDCSGCRDNFYNHPSAAKAGEGTSPTGMCWSLPTATKRHRWSIGMQTPMDKRERFHKVCVYDCFHGEGPYRDIYIDRLPAHLGGDWADKKYQREQEGKEDPRTARARGKA